jgi:SNF2 family DNA or RNA helicase
MSAGDKKTQALQHQADGTAFLRARERAALFDEQGLGKSKQLIDAIVGEIEAGTVAGALIVCPNGLKSNWGEEIERFCSLPFAVFGAGKAARRQAFSSLKAAFYVINYESVAAELPALRALLRFKRIALVLDESHRIKTPDARVTRAVLQLRSEAARRYLLTGTPVANKPEDLWSQILFLDDGEALGATVDEFRERYQTGNGGYQDIDDLRGRVAGLSLRRLKSEALDLPVKTYRRVEVALAGRQLELYTKMRDELALWVKTLDGDEVLKEAEAILARLVRLAQLASNPRLVDQGYHETPAKFLALDELVTRYMAADGQKMIIWSSFVGNVNELAERYAQYGAVVIHGEVSAEDRDRAVKSFRTEPGTRILIANPAAAREGLTLTEANVAVYVDRTFNLVDYLQSQDRIHRISQTRECEIILLVAKDTIDLFVDFSLEQKHRLAQFAQDDSDAIAPADLALEKPEILRALLAPADAAGAEQ